MSEQTIEIRDHRGAYYWIDRCIYKEYLPKIGIHGLAIYNAFCFYANAKTQSLWPSSSTICKHLQISQPTFRKYRNKLIKQKLIEIETRNGYTPIVTLLRPTPKTGYRGGGKLVIGGDGNQFTMNNNNKNKNIKNKSKSHSRNSRCESQKDLKTSSKVVKNMPSKKDHLRAKRLRDIILSKRNVQLNIHGWPEIFRKLRQINKISPHRIKTVLDWYSHHIGEDFVPEAYCARSFRDKFVRIESAMTKSKTKSTPPEDEYPCYEESEYEKLKRAGKI